MAPALLRHLPQILGLPHRPATSGRLRLGACLALALALLGGCSSSVQVSGQFPRPVVAPLPLSAGLYLSPELAQHSYREQDEQRRQWTISTGAAQQSLFNTLVPALVQSYTPISQDPREGVGGDVDIVICPSLQSFQYSTPNETSSKVFEVWLKYNMQIYRADGSLLADWYTSAYGKTPSAFMRSAEAALNAAVIVALRDLGANLSINLARVPELQSWLDQRAGERAQIERRPR